MNPLMPITIIGPKKQSNLFSYPWNMLKVLFIVPTFCNSPLPFQVLIEFMVVTFSQTVYFVLRNAR